MRPKPLQQNLKNEKVKLSRNEQSKYVMADSRDYQILASIKQLEQKPLSKEDQILVALIRTQLEKDWRKPLMKMLEKMKQKY